jgi:hypothetical protein
MPHAIGLQTIISKQKTNAHCEWENSQDTREQGSQPSCSARRPRSRARRQRTAAESQPQSTWPDHIAAMMRLFRHRDEAASEYTDGSDMSSWQLRHTFSAVHSKSLAWYGAQLPMTCGSDPKSHNQFAVRTSRPGCPEFGCTRTRRWTSHHRTIRHYRSSTALHRT